MVVKAMPKEELVIAELKAMGFSDEFVAPPRRLIVSSAGREKTGKSHFALTGPPPIIYLDVDVGTEGVVEKFQAESKQILCYAVRIPREAKQDVHTPLWNDVKLRVRKAYSLKQGTVVWDTATEVYELARLAHFGRLTDIKPSDYTIVNNEWRELLRVAYDSPMNTVFIHKMRAVWRVVSTSSGRSQLTKTNDYELSGFSEMDYLAQVNLVHYREDTDAGTTFSVLIKDSRHSPGIAGTVLRGMPVAPGQSRTMDPMCNFEFLLSLVHDK